MCSFQASANVERISGSLTYLTFDGTFLISPAAVGAVNKKERRRTPDGINVT